MLYHILNQQYSDIIDTDKSMPLWSGCGEVRKMRLDGQNRVVKFAQVPEQLSHPRIKQSNIALARKLKSYQVELDFYQYHSQELRDSCAVPEFCYGVQRDDATCLVLSDFTNCGFAPELEPNMTQHRAILDWLAQFHCYFLHPQKPVGWQCGGYWHLDTRPDEWKKMLSSELKMAAKSIDHKLRECAYQCVIHGDSKAANFALNHKNDVIGYDFQYVGHGIGVQDVMLYFTSVFDERDLYDHSDMLLEYYFSRLGVYLKEKLTQHEVTHLEHVWRTLWPFVWADFHRFLMGWKPEHFKINQYMLEQSQSALSNLRNL